MNVDFHFHSCLTKGIPFDYGFFREASARARAVGLDAIIITDHIEGGAFASIYATLDERHAYNGHYYLVDGVRFYPGAEVQVQEGPHLLVSGTREAVLTFFERVQAGRAPETYVTLAEFFERQAGLDVMNVVGHPLRPKRELSRIGAEQIARFDALDLNAKDLWRGGPAMRGAVEALAAEHGRPVVAGSDTHHYLQLGSVYNAVHRPFETIGELRALIGAGMYTVHVRPELTELVERAQETKRAIKQDRYGLISTKAD